MPRSLQPVGTQTISERSIKMDWPQQIGVVSVASLFVSVASPFVSVARHNSFPLESSRS